MMLDRVNELLSVGLKSVEGIYQGSKEVRFYTKDGYMISMYHEQECYESVELEDADSIGSGDDIYTDCEWCKLYEAKGEAIEFGDHITWTFYRVRTSRGYDTLRWYGESNGYYSEEVNFEIKEPKANGGF